MAHQKVSPYMEDYSKALKLYNSSRFIAAIQQAKDNLADLNLPRYWQIKNSCLIIIAEYDWEAAEVSQPYIMPYLSECGIVHASLSSFHLPVDPLVEIREPKVRFPHAHETIVPIGPTR